MKGAIKFVSIHNTNPYSSVIKILDKSSKAHYCIKFIRKSKKHIFEYYDLSVLFGRDRIFASSYFENQFSQIASCKKYLPDLIVKSSSENILIYKNDDLEQRELSKLIYEDESDKWIDTIIKLSDNFYLNKINKNIPKQLSNPDLLKLKMNLQIIKPLLHIFPNKELKVLLKNIGPLFYLNHGDLQPKNILISDQKITIIDFEEGFYGPKGWDLGFLWGNILYLSAKKESLFDEIKEVWVNYCFSKPKSKYRFNLFLFTLSTLLFRLYLFPLVPLSEKNKLLLKQQTETFKKYIIP